MQLERRLFLPILLDNEEAYFKLLEAVLNSIDEFSEAEVTSTKSGYVIRIAPSHPEYLMPILQAIKSFNSSLGIQVEFSKSMKATSTIAFILNNQK